MLRAIGREGEITSKARESAHSLGRLLTFLAHAANERKEDKPLQARIRTAARDVTSLTDHATFLSGKIIFLLDATLGMINIQQNDIIKIFSIAAVVFLPPTLLASIYGMNFHHMPELELDGSAIRSRSSSWCSPRCLPYHLFQAQGLAVIWACLSERAGHTAAQVPNDRRGGDGDRLKES